MTQNLQSPNQQTTYTQYEGNPTFYKNTGTGGDFGNAIFVFVVFKLVCGLVCVSAMGLLIGAIVLLGDQGFLTLFDISLIAGPIAFAIWWYWFITLTPSDRKARRERKSHQVDQASSASISASNSSKSV